MMRSHQGMIIHQSFTIWNAKSIPDNFLLSDDIVRQIDEIIQQIESRDMSQQELDMVYDSFCKCVLDEMERKPDKKMVHINTGLSNKRRRVKKPWWSDNLNNLWNELCVAEKCCHKSPLSKKTRLKTLMREAQRVFDKNVQSAKRTYWRENQEYLLNLNTTNPQEFWKRIGQIGMATERRKSIPMEVVKDGVLYNDKAVVINE